MAWYLSQNGIPYESEEKLDDNDLLLPDKPSEYHVWDNENNCWAVELEDLKLIKLSEILEAFEIRLYDNVGVYSPTIGKYVDSTRESLQDYEKLLDKMVRNGIDKYLFRCYDDEFVEVTQEQLRGIINDVVNYGLYLYRKKWEYEALINSAESIDDVIDLYWED